MSAPNGTIREFRDGDSTALVQLVRELQAHELRIFDRMKKPNDIDIWYIDRLKAECAKQGGAIIVAENADGVIGYACVLTQVQSEDDLDETSYTYALVADLAVAQHCRGQGIGTRLLNSCEEMAAAAGARWLRIGVLAANTDAGRLYRRFGFRDHLIELEKPL